MFVSFSTLFAVFVGGAAASGLALAVVAFLFASFLPFTSTSTFSDFRFRTLETRGGARPRKDVSRVHCV